MAMAPVFHTTKVIMSHICSEGYLSPAPGASFYPLLVSFHLQTTYEKVRNLRIGVNKLVG